MLPEIEGASIACNLQQTCTTCELGYGSHRRRGASLEAIRVSTLSGTLRRYCEKQAESDRTR